MTTIPGKYSLLSLSAFCSLREGERSSSIIQPAKNFPTDLTQPFEGQAKHTHPPIKYVPIITVMLHTIIPYSVHTHSVHTHVVRRSWSCVVQYSTNSPIFGKIIYPAGIARTNMYTFPQKNTLEQCLVKTDSIGQSESCKNRRHFVVKHRLLIINHRRYCISLYSISIGTPRSSSMETAFPCLYNCTVQLYRQTATAVYSRQSGYTDREKSSQLMTTGGGPIRLQG